MIKRMLNVFICIFAMISFVTPIVATAATTSTDDVAALEARIAELEAEVKMYQDRQAKMSIQMEIIMFESDKIGRCDINGDTLIDATDASIILQAYALLSTGEDIQKISQVINYDETKYSNGNQLTHTNIGVSTLFDCEEFEIEKVEIK